MIEQGYDRALTGGELAACAGLSKGAFHRAFKATFGTTPFRFLTRRRVEAAARLMVTTDMSLLTIAVETGFYDQAHLCRQFRKAFGESPDRWRRREREAGRLAAHG
ncbi:helix-turn-helix transcriptional regulator [Luteibacter sp. 621]|uniref:helix-turn-helix transcriptional regulator n=1 Tax=Luteibacter sp. 621 TaxID=3373916 RepID=UPI003D25A8F6